MKRRKQIKNADEISYWDALLYFIELGLIDQHTLKPISKTRFKEQAVVKTYGRGRDATRIAYFGKPKEFLCAFHPRFADDNKERLLNVAYNRLLEIVHEKELSGILSGCVEFGNKGYPLAVNPCSPEKVI